MKGCFHPLPGFFFVPRVVSGKKVHRPIIANHSNQGLNLVRHPCLGGRRAFIVHPGNARLLSPIMAAKNLKTMCSSKLCKAALDFLEYLSAEGEGLVGVTGSLAYDPRNAEDIDLVAYGPRIERVYKALRDLRKDGITLPFRGRGHAWSDSDYYLNNVIASQRLLFGRYKGFEYNVRLVYCTKPARCTPIKVLGEAVLEADIVSSISFSTPAFYLMRIRRVLGTDVALPTRLEHMHMMTFRLRYMEIPTGSRVMVKGEIESLEGVLRIVPDHVGFVHILSLP